MDKTIIEKIKNGDASAFETLYKETYSKSFYLAKYLANNTEMAEDITQQAYIKVWQKINQFEADSNFEAWLNSIVRSTAIDELRKRQLTFFEEKTDKEGNIFSEYDFLEDKNSANQPELHMEQKESSRLLQEILNELTEEQRICVLMFYYQDLSVKEIAKELGVSPNTVKSRLNYGRKNIMGKVKAMEAKGTKLYSIAPGALIIYLLKANVTEASAAEIPANLLTAVKSTLPAAAETDIGLTATAVQTGVTSAVSKAAGWTLGRTITAAVAGLALAGSVTTAAVVLPNLNGKGNANANPAITTTLTQGVTSTPGATEAPTPSATEAPTPSATEAPTPSATEAPTPSATEAPTPSATETPTPSATEAPTPSPTATPLPSPTMPLIIDIINPDTITVSLDDSDFMQLAKIAPEQYGGNLARELMNKYLSTADIAKYYGPDNEHLDENGLWCEDVFFTVGYDDHQRKYVVKNDDFTMEVVTTIGYSAGPAKNYFVRFMCNGDVNPQKNYPLLYGVKFGMSRDALLTYLTSCGYDKSIHYDTPADYNPCRISITTPEDYLITFEINEGIINAIFFSNVVR